MRLKVKQRTNMVLGALVMLKSSSKVSSGSMTDCVSRSLALKL